MAGSSNNLDLALRIKTAVEGLQGLEQLGDHIDALGGDSKELRAEASKLAADLSLLARQQGVIDNFQQTSQAAADTAAKLAELRAQSTAAESAQSTLTGNLQALGAQLSSTRAHAEELRSQLQQESVTVEELTARFGRNSQFVAEAKQAHQGTTQAIKDAETAERVLSKAIAEDEQALSAQTAALTKLNPKIQQSEAAAREQAEALTKAGKAADYAGVNTSDLTAEQQRVTRETINAKSATVELTDRMQDERTALGGAELAAQKMAAKTKMLGDEQKTTADKNKEFEQSIRRAGAALLTFAGVQVGRQVITDLAHTADEIRSVEARLQLATKSQEAFNAAQLKLTEIAQVTRSTYGATVDLYSNLARSTEQLNIPQQQLLDLTETISQAMKIGGGSAEAQNAALVQLSQGFASGVLRGDEFNSVMEQSPRLTKALADGLNVPIGALRTMAEAGELTSEKIVKALQSQRAAIETEFATVPATIGGAVTQLDNAVAFYVRDFDKANQVSAKTVELIQGVASHLDEIAKLAAIAGEVMLANLAVKGVKAAIAFAAELTKAATEAGSVAAAVGKIPTSLKIAIAVVGFELLQEAGKLMGEYAAQLSGVDDAVKAFSLNRRRQLYEEVIALEGVARTLADYRGLQLLTNDDLAALGKTAQQTYAAQLDGLEKLLLTNNSLYLREQELAKLRGDSTAEWDKKLASNATQLAAVRDEQDKVAAALDHTATAIKDGVTPAALALVEKFDQMTAKGKSAAEAIAGITASLNVEHSKSVEDVIGALGKLADQGKITAQDLDRELGGAINKLSDEDLIKLRVTAEAAFSGSAEQAGVLGATIDAIRTEQFARLGVDAGAVLDGIDAKTGKMLDSFRNLVSDPGANPQLITDAFKKLLATVDSPQELESLKAALGDVKLVGVDAADAIAQKLATLPAAEQDVVDGITLATQGVKDLAAEYDKRIEREKAAAAAALAGNQQTIDSNQELEVSFDSLRQGIGNADSVQQLEKFRSAAQDAFAKGKLSAEEYLAIIKQINEQEKLLATYIDLWSVARGAAEDFLGGVSKKAKAYYDDLIGVRDSTKLATDSIEGMQASIKTLGSWITGNMRAYTDEWWGSLAKLANQGFAVERQTLSQKVALEQWIETLSAANDGTIRAGTDLGDLANKAERATSQFGLLDDADLSRLQQQIDTARQKLDGLRDSAASTLENLNEELAQAQGNLVQAQQLRNEQRVQDLQAQLAAAQAAGDQQSIATLKQALSTLQQINTLSIQTAKQQQAQQQQVTPTPATKPTPSTPSTQTITINLPGIGSAQVSATSSEAAKLQALLRELERQAGAST